MNTEKLRTRIATKIITVPNTTPNTIPNTILNMMNITKMKGMAIQIINLSFISTIFYLVELSFFYRLSPN